MTVRASMADAAQDAALDAATTGETHGVIATEGGYRSVPVLYVVEPEEEHDGYAEVRPRDRALEEVLAHAPNQTQLFRFAVRYGAGVPVEEARRAHREEMERDG